MPAQSTWIEPAATIDQAVDAFKAYQTLKDRLGDPGDFIERRGIKMPKKSFVRKVQRYFGLAVGEIIRDEPFRNDDGRIIGWLCTVRASHPGGGAQIGDGAATLDEKACRDHLPTVDMRCSKCLGNATLHNIRAHARTRAQNRAIMDLVGFGDVTADEIPAGDSGSGRKFRSPTSHGECPLHKGWYFEDGKYGAYHPDGKHPDGKSRFCNKDYAWDAYRHEQSARVPPDLLRARQAARGALTRIGDDTSQGKWIHEQFPELVEVRAKDFSIEQWGDILTLVNEHFPAQDQASQADEAGDADFGEGPAPEESPEPTINGEELPW